MAGDRLASGFGRAIVEAALAAGDLVVATARRPEALAELVAAHPDHVEAPPLDVTDAPAAAALVADVQARYGRIDVLVNNAGRGQVGAAEETTEQELRDLFDLHVFGRAALVRAVLPGMRARGVGAIVQMSSFGGQVAYPGFSASCTTKFALEVHSEALAAEVGPLGVQVLVVEPGAFRTGFSGTGLVQTTPIAAYDDTAGPTRAMITGIDGTQPGDPARAAAAILTALDAEHTPLRLPLGDDAVDGVLGHLDEVAAEVHAWEHLAGPPPTPPHTPSSPTTDPGVSEAIPPNRSGAHHAHHPLAHAASHRRGRDGIRRGRDGARRLRRCTGQCAHHASLHGSSVDRNRPCVRCRRSAARRRPTSTRSTPATSTPWSPPSPPTGR